MRELLRTNDPVLLAKVTALLDGEGITTVVFDQHLSSAFAGLVDLVQRRVMVADDDYAQAQRLLAAAASESSPDE